MSPTLMLRDGGENASDVISTVCSVACVCGAEAATMPSARINAIARNAMLASLWRVVSVGRLSGRETQIIPQIIEKDRIL